MVELRRSASMTPGAIPDVALELVLAYIDHPRDRDAVSLVCRAWHRADGRTRRHVTIAMSYSASPARVARRFPCLVSLKLKSKPRAAMFNLFPADWGGAAVPWLAHMASSSFELLRSLHLRRMVVTDPDLSLLAAAKGPRLLSLRLDKCDGFSTDGLCAIATSCRRLETLFLEDCSILDKSPDWLRLLATNNSSLLSLNFFNTDLSFCPDDLLLLARHCPSLTSLKISERDISHLVPLFQAAKALQEFAGGSFEDDDSHNGGIPINKYSSPFYFPPSLQSLCLSFMTADEMHIIFPYAATLKKLDLQYALLSTEDHCQLIPRCPNLLVLAVSNTLSSYDCYI